MRLFISIILFSVAVWVTAQDSFQVGDKIQAGTITLVNNEKISFFSLEFDYDDKITFTNAQSLEKEFLYNSSVKSIETDDNLTYNQDQIAEIQIINKESNEPKEKTFTTITYKDKSIELENPSEGKSVVYFVRTSSTAYLINFRYFDYDQFIGKFAGAGYIRYECDPGEHAFWIGASNSSYVTAMLEEGKIYVIETIPVMGMAYARVKVEIPDRLHPKKYDKQKKRIFAILSDEKFDKTNPKDVLYATQSDYKKEIERGVEIYQKREEKEQDHLLHPLQFFE